MKLTLSDAEWTLMNALWDDHPQTITALVRALAPVTGWTKSTVITMLTRLAAKGAVGVAEGARAKQFTPLLRREEARRAETRRFLDRIYGGSLGLLVQNMVDSRGLTPAELTELRAILDEAEEVRS